MTPARRLLPLLFLAAQVLACASDSTDRTPGADGGEMGTTLDSGGPTTSRDGGGDGDGDDDPVDPGDGDGDGGASKADSGADACVPQGCEEQGFECGVAEDGCGGELNCDPSAASACQGFEYCGGDPDKGANKCGCRPRTCEELGAACGSDVPDGCGGTVESCGSCNAGNLCGPSYQCLCSPAADPCGSAGLVCGTVSNGCETVSCGALNGACAVGAGVCAANQRSCVCTTDQVTACQGVIAGSVTVDNCTFDCTATCGEPERVAACKDAQCGTAVNSCGDTVQCGTCAGGNKCTLPTFITDAAVPSTAGYCLNENVSNLLGKYAVRVHSFRQAGTPGLDIMTRAEAVELVTMTYSRTTGRVTLQDQGCVGTASGKTGSLTAATVRVTNYHEVEPVVVTLNPLVGSQWERGPIPSSVFPGGGEATGFTPGMPTDCVGREGQTIQRTLPASGWQVGPSGNSSFAPQGASAGTYTCRCPLTASAMPVHNRATSGAIDCRAVDTDNDGLPGFSVSTKPLIGSTTQVYNASVAETVWKGTVRADRHHIATGQDPSATKSSVLGCSRAEGPCLAPTVDCACAFKWNHVQFVPLANEDAMSCDRFFTAADKKTVNQDAVELIFGAGFSTCTTTSQCPAGTLCSSNVCKPIATPGVCTGSGQSTCPAGSTCRSGSCWPTDAECDPTGVALGGMCN